MNWLIDDQLLGETIRTGKPPRGVRKGDGLFTTGTWYVRLCQAVLGPVGRGVLSAPLHRLPEIQRAKALAAILELPDNIGLLSLRDLAPRIGQLRTSYALNLLSGEAAAASETLGAKVLLSTSSPLLENALESLGMKWAVVTV